MILKVLVVAAIAAAAFSDFQVVTAPTVSVAHAQSAPQSLKIDITEEQPKESIKDPIASNCYLYVKSLIPSLPRSSDITSNTTPFVGAVVIMDFPHYAIVTKLEETGFWVKDSNWGGPGYRTHFIPWGYKHIEGFWSPSKDITP